MLERLSSFSSPIAFGCCYFVGLYQLLLCLICCGLVFFFVVGVSVCVYDT